MYICDCDNQTDWYMDGFLRDWKVYTIKRGTEIVKWVAFVFFSLAILLWAMNLVVVFIFWMSSPTYLESLRYLLKICYLSHGVEHLASIQVLSVSPTHFRRDVVNISPIPIKMVASVLLYINIKDVNVFHCINSISKIGWNDLHFLKWMKEWKSIFLNHSLLSYCYLWPCFAFSITTHGLITLLVWKLLIRYLIFTLVK